MGKYEKIKTKNEKLKQIIKAQKEHIGSLIKICCKGCHFYKLDDCGISEINIINYTKNEGEIQLTAEPVDFYFVEDEEWIHIRTTRVKDIHMPRHKSCYRREEPTEDWEHRH